MTPVELPTWSPVRVRRTSAETDIRIEIGRDRVARARVDLPDALFAHGLATFATWADLPLRLVGSGDLPHHVIEDAALGLGRALRRSLGDRPRARIGSAIVPMDETLVEVALDLSDRPYAAIDPSLSPMVRHLFRSLSDEARWTLHLRCLAGEEEHHLVEASFKALGIALGRAAEARPTTIGRKGAVRWQEDP